MHDPVERLNGARKKVTEACVEARWAELEPNLARAPKPTAKQRRAAAEACIVAPIVRPEVPKWSGVPFGIGLLGLAFVVVLILASGCVPARAIEQARKEASIAHGHAVDAAGELPIEARVIGASEARAWQEQHRALTGDYVPDSETWPPIPPEILALLPEPARSE